MKWAPPPASHLPIRKAAVPPCAHADRRAGHEAVEDGTPIVHFEPPEGVAFFGPVISRLPSEEQAGVLWDHVIGFVRFPGFAELKRSPRERPQLPSLGVIAQATGTTEDWHAGSRRLKK
ncbi:hypothetical protein [Streptomyces sp. NPDC088358]|uniref:mycothiol-dependent nitroreductase Rv2466c family protein n=1 Tax=Streptomyces sp. NPDC088358 TaxID=3365857 RepID=UPI003812E323